MNLYSWIINQRQNYKNGLLTPEQITALEEYPDWTWNTLETKWDEQYQNLVSFLEEKGKYPTQREMVWVGTQRASYRNGMLSEERIALLELLPDWSWNSLEDSWDKQYQTLVKSLDESGGMYPTRGQESNQWISNQRREHKNGRLPKERITRLEALSGWKWETKLSSSWEENYEKLLAFIKYNERLPTQEELTWVDTQRISYRKGRLSKERIELLESLPGWEWELLAIKWDSHYQSVVNYLEVNNGVYPTIMWTRDQRMAYKERILSKERIELLEALPGWEWEPLENAWNKQYETLVKFLEENGRCPTRRESPWVDKQRMIYKRGTLSKERIELLEALPKWLWRVR